MATMMARGINAPQELLEVLGYVYNLPAQTIEKDWNSHIREYLKANENKIKEQRLLRSASRHIFYKRYKEAMRDIHAALERNDKDLYAFYLAGACCFLTGELDAAASHLLKAVSLPTMFEDDRKLYRTSYLYLGKTHDLTGRRDEAIKYYNLVLGFPEYDGAHDEARTLIKEPFKQK